MPIPLTVTSQVAILPPSVVVTVIVVSPVALADTRPLASTSATAGSLLLQVTDLSVASPGFTVAVSCRVAPTAMVSDVLSREMPVTATFAGLTVTAHSAVLPPSLVVTAIFTVPAFTAVTFAEMVPEVDASSTVAVFASPVLQVTVLSLASFGSIVAVSVAVSPSTSVTSLLSSLMPLTGWVTLTSQEADRSPLLVVATMVTTPPETAVTLPSSSTVAMLELLLVHFTLLSVASAGATAAVSWPVCPTIRARVLGVTVMPVGLTTLSATVTSHDAILPPSVVFTVMTASPAFTAVTLPLSLTVATSGADVLQVIDLSVALVGETAAMRVSLAPVSRFSCFLFSSTPATLIIFLLTVTTHSAVLSPSLVVTVIFAEPSFTAVSLTVIVGDADSFSPLFDDTLPDAVASTVTIDASDVLQATSLFVASAGATVAVRVADSPSTIERLALSRLTPVTGWVTVKSQVAILPPSVVTTVTVALPLALPVTYPFSSTLATLGLLLLQLTVLSVALSGLTVAFNCCV